MTHTLWVSYYVFIYGNDVNLLKGNITLEDIRISLSCEQVWFVSVMNIAQSPVAKCLLA